MGEQQPGGPGADDADLGTHVPRLADRWARRQPFFHSTETAR